MIPAILIWRDGSESEQQVDLGPDIRVVRDGVATAFHRVGMTRSRFLYVELLEQPTLAAVPGDAS